MKRGPNLITRIPGVIVSLTVIWRCLLCVCKPIHVFICKGKRDSICIENLRPHRTKFSRAGDKAPGTVHPCSTSDRCTGTFRSLCIYALGGTLSVLL
jgi:hypothetical protein